MKRLFRVCTQWISIRELMLVGWLILCVITFRPQTAEAGNRPVVPCGISLQMFEAMAIQQGQTQDVAALYFKHYCALTELRDAYLVAPLIDDAMLDTYLDALATFRRLNREHPMYYSSNTVVAPNREQLAFWFLLMRQAMAFSSQPLDWQTCDPAEVEAEYCESLHTVGLNYILSGISLENELALYIFSADFEAALRCELSERSLDPNLVWYCPWTQLIFRPAYPEFDPNTIIHYLETGEIYLNPAQAPGSQS